jgi:hypothetical protein
MDRALFSQRMVVFDKGDHHLNAPYYWLCIVVFDKGDHHLNAPYYGLMSSNMAQAESIRHSHYFSEKSQMLHRFQGDLA